MALNRPQELGIQLLNWQLWAGFQNSKADSSLFIYCQNSVICYLLVYVDDLVIIGNNLCFVSEIVAQLSNRFSLKDMGQLNFFLGMEVI